MQRRRGRTAGTPEWNRPDMMPWETLLVDRDDHGVVTVTMNRPEKKNAMSVDMIHELTQLFDEIADSRDDRVVVLTGAGDAFTSGADLTPGKGSKKNEESFGKGGAGTALHGMRRLGRLILRLHDLPKPTIAAVNGVAVGAGCNLALGCDLIVASDAARFSEIFARRGLSLDGGGSWLLPRLIGLHKAKELAFLAEIISAEEAERYGIVNRVVPAGDFEKVVTELARRVAAQPPIQISITKKLLNQSLSVSMAEAVEFEDVAQSLAFSSTDTAEAMAAFIEKRDPKFTGE
ncbi:MAG: enoyl-CoA hydratase, partial [Dehalococcoidia bacterium]